MKKKCEVEKAAATLDDIKATADRIVEKVKNVVDSEPNYHPYGQIVRPERWKNGRDGKHS